MKASPQRPLIGVTGPNRGGTSAWLFTWLALRRAGARVVRITPARPFPAERLDALVIGGGADVTEPLVEPDRPLPPPPERVRWPRRVLDLLLAPFVLLFRYGAATHRHGVDRERDALEVALLEHAKQHDMAVLGICRGAQLMNLVEGGTLERHIDDLYDERPQLYTVLPRREVEVTLGSRLHTIVGLQKLLINSMHFHAVKEPGPGFTVVAREPRGVPQAIEHRTRSFWLGVQWHPEYLPQQRPHQLIFCALVESARAARLNSANAALAIQADDMQRFGHEADSSSRAELGTRPWGQSGIALNSAAARTTVPSRVSRNRNRTTSPWSCREQLSSIAISWHL